MRLSPQYFGHTLALAIGVTAGLCSATAAAVDWSGVAAREVPLFYPGQASWEWALTEADHSGAPKFRAGKNCKACHEGEQADIGQRIASGEKLEPTPIAGKPGSSLLHVRSAHDAERLYIELRWKPAPASGTQQEPEAAAHITVMLDDGSVKEAPRAGCWGTCHDDANGMASAPEGKQLTKYLGASRQKLSRSGGGENFKSAAELEALLQQGVFMEYWQAKLNPGQPAKAVSGYILDRRHKHDPAAIQADASFANGEWTVSLSRPLRASGPGQKDIVPGKTYAVGFALHDDYSDHRYHFVSFEYSLTLDSGSTDFVVTAR